jgi:hypothetical protein
MWKSRAITVTLLSSLMLTACCVSMSGCGSGGHAAPDHTWYDANGNRIEERWKTDEHGNRVLDAEGRLIPDPHVPYDPYHRPWVYTSGVWAPLPPPAGSSTAHRSTGLWLWGGSGYRSTSSGPSYRSTTGGGSYSPSHSSSSGSSSGSSSISRGGFGSTGSSSSS